MREFLKDYRNYGKTILQIYTFSLLDFDKYVCDFIASVASLNLADSPHIKFTLRLTSAIDAYLTLKSTENGLSKADLVRAMIVKEMESV